MLELFEITGIISFGGEDMKIQLHKGESTIDFSRNIWTGRTMISIDGKPMEKIKRNVFVFTDSEGKRTEVVIKGNELTGIQMSMPYETITVLRKLNALEIILTVIPFFLVFIGGAIGGVLGALAAFTNAMLCRSIKNVLIKIVFALFVTAIATVLWLTIGSFLLELFNLNKN
jgi:hypothetical protein